MAERTKRRHDRSAEEEALDMTPSSSSSLHGRTSKAGRSHLYSKYPAMQTSEAEESSESGRDEAIRQKDKPEEVEDKENTASPALRRRTQPPAATVTVTAPTSSSSSSPPVATSTAAHSPSFTPASSSSTAAPASSSASSSSTATSRNPHRRHQLRGAACTAVPQRRHKRTEQEQQQQQQPSRRRKREELSPLASSRTPASPARRQRETRAVASVPHSDVMSLNYVDAIYSNNLQRETKYLIDPRPPRGINLAMRTVVIDWVVEIQVSFKLREETLFCAVDLFDRYLAARPAEGRHDYQCCGATALWVACKFLEVQPPELGDFVYVCANLYPRQLFLDKELAILTSIDFHVMNVTPLDFVSIYAIVLRLSIEGTAMAEYLITLPLQEQLFYGLRPSIRGAAAVHIASKTCDGPGWSQEHSRLFRLNYDRIMMVAGQLKTLAEHRPEKYLNCRQKFTAPAKFGVAARELLV